MGNQYLDVAQSDAKAKTAPMKRRGSDFDIGIFGNVHMGVSLVEGYEKYRVSDI